MLKLRCEMAKIILSKEQRVIIHVQNFFHDNDLCVQIDRSIFEYIPWIRKIFILMPNERVRFLKPSEEIKENTSSTVCSATGPPSPQGEGFWTVPRNRSPFSSGGRLLDRAPQPVPLILGLRPTSLKTPHCGFFRAFGPLKGKAFGPYSRKKAGSASFLLRFDWRYSA